MVKEEGSPTLSPGLLDAMYEAISTNAFDLDPTPKEGDKQTVTQTRADGTRTWSYTYINGGWVLTGYKYTPTPDADSLPDEP